MVAAAAHARSPMAASGTCPCRNRGASQASQQASQAVALSFASEGGLPSLLAGILTSGEVAPTRAPPDVSQDSVSSSAAEAPDEWSKEEREAYVASLGIIRVPGEEAVLRFLSEALAEVPLPSPWVMGRDQRGQVFFVNRAAACASWSHPLEASLKELAFFCRMCRTLQADVRESVIATMHDKWQEEARSECSRWCAVRHDSGRVYYCHVETGAAMWEDPAAVFLPSHYLKIMSIKRLRSEGFLCLAETGWEPASSSRAPSSKDSGEPQSEPQLEDAAHADAAPAEGGSSPGGGSQQATQCQTEAEEMESSDPPAGLPPGLLCISMGDRVLGSVEVHGASTLADVRAAISLDELGGVPRDYLFLVEGELLSRRRECAQWATSCLPCVAIVQEEVEGAKRARSVSSAHSPSASGESVAGVVLMDTASEASHASDRASRQADRAADDAPLSTETAWRC